MNFTNNRVESLNKSIKSFASSWTDIPDLLRKLASYSAQKEAEYRKQRALATSYHRNFPGFPEDKTPKGE